MSEAELRQICQLTVELTRLRQNECKHLSIENIAPELFRKLLDAFLRPPVYEAAAPLEFTFFHEDGVGAPMTDQSPSVQSDANVETRTIPAGTLIHIGGIPLRLKEAAPMATHPRNWQLIKDADELFTKVSGSHPRPARGEGI